MYNIKLKASVSWLKNHEGRQVEYDGHAWLHIDTGFGGNDIRIDDGCGNKWVNVANVLFLE